MKNINHGYEQIAISSSALMLPIFTILPLKFGPITRAPTVPPFSPSSKAICSFVSSFLGYTYSGLSSYKLRTLSISMTLLKFS